MSATSPIAPRLAQKFGYANTFALAMLPVLLVLLAFALLAKDSSRQEKALAWRDFASILREGDTAWFCFFYCFTFGGFLLNDSPSSSSRRVASDREGESFSAAHRSTARTRLSGIRTP